jgi:hypothetical protein
MVVRLDWISPKTGGADAVAFWEWVMTVAPVLAGALTLGAGWLCGAFVDFQWVDRQVTSIQAFTILGTMMFPAAAFLAARRRWFEARAHTSVGWPTVPGVVEQSKVEKIPTLRSGTFYRLALRYRYQVDGADQLGDRAMFGPVRVSNQDLIESLADRFPVGAQVTVHYDPADPATAVLDTSDEMARQNQWQVWLFLALPIVLSIVVAIVNA